MFIQFQYIFLRIQHSKIFPRGRYPLDTSTGNHLQLWFELQSRGKGKLCIISQGLGCHCWSLLYLAVLIVTMQLQLTHHQLHRNVCCLSQQFHLDVCPLRMLQVYHVSSSIVSPVQRQKGRIFRTFNKLQILKNHNSNFLRSLRKLN